jgi:hypothetical protein
MEVNVSSLTKYLRTLHFLCVVSGKLYAKSSLYNPRGETAYELRKEGRCDFLLFTELKSINVTFPVIVP